MDLGSEFVEENEVNQNGTDEKFDGNSDANTLAADQKETTTVVEVASSEAVNPTGTPTKGFGLKKWKRIRRDVVVKDPNSIADSSKILKRGLVGAGAGTGNANFSEGQPFLRDVKQHSEGSSNMFGNVGFSDGYATAIRGSSSDSRCAIGSGFVVGTDSENSEDRSSKSSTAASEPKLRYEKSRSRSVNSKNIANSAQRVQHGKGRIESGKKPGGGGGGGGVKMEKENSLSSIASDSRNSNFKQGIFTVTSNGKHSGGPNIYGGGNSGEARTNEHLNEEAQVGYGNEHVGEDEHFLRGNLATNLSWDVTEEKGENNQSSTTEDPLIESISILQALQEALEEEVQKFREIGNEAVSADDDSAKCSRASADIIAVDLGFNKSCLSGQADDVEEIKQTASSSLELQVLSLTQNVNLLESKLEELRVMLALKDSRIAELETALSSVKFPKEETASTVGLLEEKCKEVESEIEGLFRQKIEAEVEYLSIRKMMQKLKVAAGFQLTLLEEEETRAENQAQVANKLGEAGSKSEELEKYCGETLVVKETSVMQSRVCKVAFFFFIQFVLLILFFWLFVLLLLPSAGVVVPT